MSSSRNIICATRAIKNIEFIKHSVPQNVTKKDLEELANLPPEVLQTLHTRSSFHDIVKNNELVHFLENIKIPSPKEPGPNALFNAPLFNGTLVFVQIIFNRPTLPPFFLDPFDLQTAIVYTRMALIPIQRYAEQYGIPPTVNVAPAITQFSVTLPAATSNFSGDDLRGWVKEIVANNGLANSCIVVLCHTSGPQHAASGGFLGYHGMTDNKIPFIFCKVRGNNWTVDDSASNYVGVLSHEISEMVVDPAANLSNPEVCDGCAGNCGDFWADCFDTSSNFLGGSKTIPPTFSYSFFINSIIKRDAIDPMSNESCALNSIGQMAACSYAMRQVPFLFTENLTDAIKMVKDARLVPNVIDESIAEASKDPQHSSTQQTVQELSPSVIPWIDDQSPEGGHWLPEGSPVTMHVSHHPQP